MEHTNQIAVKILKEEYYDYSHNPECKWHYDSQYKMLVKAIEMASAGKNEPNTPEPHLPLADVIKSVCEANEWGGGDWRNDEYSEDDFEEDDFEETRGNSEAENCTCGAYKWSVIRCSWIQVSDCCC